MVVAPIGFPSLELAAQSVPQSATPTVYRDPKVQPPLPKQDVTKVIKQTKQAL